MSSGLSVSPAVRCPELYVITERWPSEYRPGTLPRLALNTVFVSRTWVWSWLFLQTHYVADTRWDSGLGNPLSPHQEQKWMMDPFFMALWTSEGKIFYKFRALARIQRREGITTGGDKSWTGRTQENVKKNQNQHINKDENARSSIQDIHYGKYSKGNRW